MITDSFAEDLIANALLGVVLISVTCMRDFCIRVSHSDCAYEDGLRIRLPTWHARSPDDDETV